MCKEFSWVVLKKKKIRQYEKASFKPKPNINIGKSFLATQWWVNKARPQFYSILSQAKIKSGHSISCYEICNEMSNFINTIAGKTYINDFLEGKCGSNFFQKLKWV